MNSTNQTQSVAIPQPQKQARPNILRPLHTLSGFVRMIVKRQLSQLGLTLLSLLSIILTVGLVTNTSFFSRAVDRVLLRKELIDFSATTGRPPFSSSVDFFATSGEPLSLDTAEKFSTQIVNVITANVSLPLRHIGFQASSGGLLLSPASNSTEYATGSNGYLDTIETMYIAGVAPHITVSDGQAFDEKGQSKQGVMDVWMNEVVAQKLGLKVGESFKVGVNLNSPQVQIQVAGFYHPNGRENEFWFSDPEIGLSNVLIVRRQDFIKFIEPILPSKTRGVSWYVILEDAGLNPANSVRYLNGYKASQYLLNQLIQGIRFNTAPLTPLSNFIDRSGSLTILLLTYNLPAFLILVFFLALISSILSRWQRKEMSLLVGRGMTIGGVLNYVLVEQIILFIVGVPFGILLGMANARLMGYSASFLTFTARDALPVNIADISIPLTLLALTITLLTRLWQAAQASLKSKVVEEREWARSTRPPFWYRYYLDLILILPTYYFYDQITKQGSLANLVSNTNTASDLFRDPLLILVPALFIVTGSLVIMRLFALVMSLLDLIASLTPWLTIHLALRQLSRQSQEYLQPLLLVIISLALGVYTLSMAASLDQWLIDRMYYKSGSDLAFSPQELSSNLPATNGDFVPAPAEMATIPGVQGAARVSKLGAQINMGDGQAPLEGHFLLLDRVDFARVSWFRDDFASESLGGLMNKLATTMDGVLIPRQFINKTSLHIGDSISVTVGPDYKNVITTNFTIVGVYDYFPTVYQEDGVTLVGNMENVNNLLGFTVPHRVWLRLAPGTDGTEVLKAIASAAYIKTIEVQDARVSISDEENQNERVGIYGTLTMSFIATAVMAILGLLIYSYASLRERVYHLAMLLSMGVERSQIMNQVIMEYSFLAVFGVLAGAVIGLTASQLFVPFFRFTGEKGVVPLPPLQPIIAWPQVWILVIAFTALVVIAEIITITLSIRRQIAQLLK